MPFTGMSVRGPALKETELEAFESSLWARLPDAYREFLLQWNGGEPEPDGFRVGAEVRRIARCYSISATFPLDDLSARRQALHRLVPGSLLAIARDVSGNLICLGIVGPRLGGVYYFTIDRESRLRHSQPIRIGRSFSDFLVGLFTIGAIN